MEKSADAFRTISEVADELRLPQHVLRFWETRFPQIRPLKRAGGRRYYRPADTVLLRTIRRLLYDEGYTIKGVQRLLKEQGARRLNLEGLPSAAEHPDDGQVEDGPGALRVDAFAAEAAQGSLEDDADTTFLSDASPAPAGDEGDLRDVLAVMEACLGILQAVR